MVVLVPTAAVCLGVSVRARAPICVCGCRARALTTNRRRGGGLSAARRDTPQPHHAPETVVSEMSGRRRVGSVLAGDRCRGEE